MTGPRAARRDATDAPLDRIRTLLPGSPELAGWATVDVDRVAVGEAAGVPDDEALGARCRFAAREAADGVVVLEPRTEGRLAAWLARHGEGRAATYVLAGADGSRRLADGGVALDPPTGGPLGRQRLVGGEGRWGPWILICEATAPPAPGQAATIAAMTEPSPDVVLRPVVPEDADAIAALLTEEGYPAGPSDVLARLERFGSPFSGVIVAEVAGQVLGFVAFHALPRFEHDDRIVRMLALIVDPGARERGLGHRLMDEVERHAREIGAAFVEVTSGHHRPEARLVYESLGYDPNVTSYLRKRV